MIDISALQIDSNYLSRDFIDTYIETLTWVGGLIWVLIFLPIYYLVQCHSIRVFKKMYPDEQVVYVVSSGIISATIITYMLGAAFFCDIVPFIIFKNLEVSIHITLNILWISVIIYIIVIWVQLFIFSLIYVLSNKRIKLITKFNKVPYEEQIKSNILYEDIESVSVNDYLTIYFKDKRKSYSFSFGAHLKQAKEIILNYINIERT